MNIIRYANEWEDLVMERIMAHQKESNSYQELNQCPVWVRKNLNDLSDFIILATDGDTLLGFIWIGIIPHWHSPELGAADHIISVDPKFRGKSTGKKLIEAAEILAESMGCVYFQLSTAFHTDRDNRTLAYYQRLGYCPRGGAVYKQLRK
jgi:GNAT superfamily N-acetyltransferase